jgi:hypothetical protein
MNDFDHRGRVLAQALWTELEEIEKTAQGAAGKGFFDAFGAFLRGRAGRMAGEAGAKEVGRHGTRVEGGRIIRGRRMWEGPEKATAGQLAGLTGARALEWAGHNPRTAAGLAGAGLVGAGFAGGRATS